MLNIKQRRQKITQRWLDKRIPASESFTLHSRNLFILPKSSGTSFIFIGVAIYILGTNYANNLILLLGYFVFALLLVAMFLSFFNLSGLNLTANRVQNIFLNDSIALSFRTQSQKRRFNVDISSTNSATDDAQNIACIEEGQDNLVFKIKPTKRGLYEVGRLRWQSSAPIGLFKVWTYLNFDQKIMVYPAPLPCPQWLEGTGLLNDTEGQLKSNKQVDEFQGLKPFTPSDPIKHVAWKQLAQGKGWYTKSFSGEQQEIRWYSYHRMAANNHEEKLSYLTWLVLQSHQSSGRFGLELQNQTIEPDSGEEFINQCLQALALHP
ncbi:MAG: DUF58 domain-containing protein [Colwellia sp.]